MPVRLTAEEFIKKAKEIHINKGYNYSKVNYINNYTPIIIICPKHGDFLQRPYNHLHGQGCPKCANEQQKQKKTLGTKAFIDKVKKIAIHKNKHYDYSKVKYINNYTKVCITCPKHGEFWQTPNKHLRGHGCPKCSQEERRKKLSFSTKEFIEKVKSSESLGGKCYDYSKTKYVNSHTPIIITCPIHGDFRQIPYLHLHGKGCPLCSIEERNTKNIAVKTKIFIEKSKNIDKYNGRNYNYSKTKFINSNTKVCITCPKHGDFYQLPYVHLQGHGCPQCANDIKRKNKKSYTEEFVLKAKSVDVHKDKGYIYDKTVYIDSKTPVVITCPKHGDFLQRPNNHLQGQGCPKCNTSYLEIRTENLLKQNNIIYEAQKKFEWLTSVKNKKMSLDFFIPSYNIGIECQGEQHYDYRDNSFFTEEVVNAIKQRDILKKQLCEQHGIIIYYIKYDENIEDAINKIIKIIKDAKTSYE